MGWKDKCGFFLQTVKDCNYKMTLQSTLWKREAARKIESSNIAGIQIPTSFYLVTFATIFKIDYMVMLSHLPISHYMGITRNK